MVEWNGSTFTLVANPPAAPNNSSFHQNFMLLPTGEVLLTDFSNDIEMYRPTVTTPVAAAVPVISTISATTLVHGGTFTMTANNHVFYCRTFNHSTRAIGPSVSGTTSFTVPSTTETGAARVQLIANG